MHTSAFKTLLLFLMLGLCCIACSESATDIEKQAVKLQLNLDNFTTKEIRAIAANEDEVQTMDVIFFDGSGNKVSFPVQTGGTRVIVPYFTSVTGKAGTTTYSPAATAGQMTLPLDVQAPDVQGLKAVVLLNLSSNVRNLLDIGAVGEIKTYTALMNAQHKQETAPSDLTNPFLMVGETNVTFINLKQDNTIPVNVSRAVARVDLVLHYVWKKLNPTADKIGQPGNAGLYTNQDFEAKTFVGEHVAISTPRIDDAPIAIAKPTSDPAPGTYETTLTTYVNEYNIGPGATTGTSAVNAPTVLLELPARIGDEPPSVYGQFPPPAGGDYDKSDVKCFYRVVLPREIKRNYHYVIHAYIIAIGSPTAAGAATVQQSFTVAPWTPIVVHP